MHSLHLQQDDRNRDCLSWHKGDNSSISLNNCPINLLNYWGCIGSLQPAHCSHSCFYVQWPLSPDRALLMVSWEHWFRKHYIAHKLRTAVVHALCHSAKATASDGHFERGLRLMHDITWFFWCSLLVLTALIGEQNKSETSMKQLASCPKYS